MSDSLALSNKIAIKAAGGDNLEIPRYYDLSQGKPPHKEQEETPEQIISRFDKLRRR